MYATLHAAAGGMCGGEHAYAAGHETPLHMRFICETLSMPTITTYSRYQNS